MKTSTSVALKFAFLFILAPHSQAEEHYIYNDLKGGLVLSNQKPPAGSTIFRKLDLPEFRETQLQQLQESAGARSIGKSEASPKHELKNKLAAGR